jgi:hypothetical protein
MGKSRWLPRGAAVIALILPAALILGPAASNASSAPLAHASSLPLANFAAQAKAAHLSAAQQASLQSEVNHIIARYGGRQVALNEIALGRGAFMLFPLPGQSVARILPGTPSLPVNTAKVAHAARNAVRPAWSTGETWYEPDGGASCPFYYFCMWQNNFFKGVQFNVSWCNVWQELPGSGWNGDGSFVNNQSFYTDAYLTDQSQQEAAIIEPSVPVAGPYYQFEDWDWEPFWYAMACQD